VLIEEGVSGSVPVEERPIGGQLFAKLRRGDIVIAANRTYLCGEAARQNQQSISQIEASGTAPL
jgi:hypothetical protein